MVYSEHDANFYALDKQVKMCVHAFVCDWEYSYCIKFTIIAQFE